MTEPPPPRYRVVEEGRRLIVIDRWAEDGRPEPVTPATQIASSASAESSATDLKSFAQMKRKSFDARSELLTHPIYDDKGPRAIQLDPGSAATIGRALLIMVVCAFTLVLLAIWKVWLLLPVFLLWNGNLRSQLRAAITRWLDTVEAG